MRILSFVLGTMLLLASCASNYETEQLYGAWQGEKLGLTLNEDGSAVITLDGVAFGEEVAWRDAIGNTLEFTSNGKVILDNVTVKGVSPDTLTIELRPLIGRSNSATELHHLIKVPQ